MSSGAQIANLSTSPLLGSHLDVLSASRGSGYHRITTGKSASVYECVRSCRYAACLECQLMTTMS